MDGGGGLDPVLAWDSGLHLWDPLPKALILAVLSLAAQPQGPLLLLLNHFSHV